MLFQVSELHQLRLLHSTQYEFIDVVLRQQCVALTTFGPYLLVDVMSYDAKYHLMCHAGWCGRGERTQTQGAVIN